MYSLQILAELYDAEDEVTVATQAAGRSESALLTNGLAPFLTRSPV